MAGRRAKMSERDKRIVEGYFFKGKTMSELAEEEGITAQAVHKLIHTDKAGKYLLEMQEMATRRARGHLAGLTDKAAKVMGEILDAKDPYAQIQAAREILERTGVKAEETDANIQIEFPVTITLGMPEEIKENDH